MVTKQLRARGKMSEANSGTTNFAEIALHMFEGFPLDGQSLADSWRRRLSIQTDEDLLDSLGYVRRSLLTLEMQVQESKRLKDRTRAFNLEVVQGLISFTDVSALHRAGKDKAGLIHQDKLHNLANLSDLLEDDFPRPVLPAAEVANIAKALQELLAQIEGADLPPVLKGFLLQQVRRLLWAVQHASILGADATLEVTLQVFGVLRHAPAAPEEAAETMNGLAEKVGEQVRKVLATIDAAEKGMKRAKTVLAIGGAVASIFIGKAY